MLSELCKELKNWFEKSKINGTFTISDGHIDCAGIGLPILEDQYFRIIGSVFNDGVWQYKAEGIADIKDETFIGEVWLMAIPREVISLNDEIEAWRAKYDTADSTAMSPFNSESFGGYSYTKGSVTGNSDGSGGLSWRSVFAGKLNMWRKV